MSAAYALRKAMLAALNSDAALLSQLGGAHVYDIPPRAIKPPYVHLSSHRTRDWSTASDEGSEHAIEFHVITAGESTLSTNQIAERLRAILHLATLTMNGHRLVNLRHLETEQSRSNGNKDNQLMVVRLRAVTEQI